MSKTRELVLTKHEAESTTWQKVDEWLEYKLQNLRESNDNQDLDDLDTAAIRGKIALIKEFQKLAPRARKGIVVNIPGGTELPEKRFDDL